jgi:dinuclear metal center YbgI/SA1388 family protein
MENQPTITEVIALLNDFAPPCLAAEWDNVGLLLGDSSGPVERIMTCLTVTDDVVAEAVAEKVQLLVSHHPILFRPIRRMTAADADGNRLLTLTRAGVAVYSPHTSFDNCPGGINDILARRLGLNAVAPLRFGEGPRQCKVVVFVPDSDLERVADAMFAAGAGHIGEYSQCSFRLAGTGTFFGSEAANPTIGEKGRREQVSEWRLEAICPEALAESVVTAMRKAHSYEEPAYDVYPLRIAKGPGGFGRIGQLARPMSLGELASLVKTQLTANYLHLVGESGRIVERVAIACGAGGEFLPESAQARADVFLTGELRFHDILTAQSQGVALILPGHYATERCGIEELATVLQKRFPSLKVWPSRKERDPISYTFGA